MLICLEMSTWQYKSILLSNMLHSEFDRGLEDDQLCSLQQCRIGFRCLSSHFTFGFVATPSARTRPDDIHEPGLGMPFVGTSCRSCLCCCAFTSRSRLSTSLQRSVQPQISAVHFKLFHLLLKSASSNSGLDQLNEGIQVWNVCSQP